MSQDAIIAKLTNELNGPITTERQVVYILVEIRKFMEQAGIKETFTALTFHCDWIAHSRLSGPIAQEIVRDVDGFQKMLDDANLGPGVMTTSVPGRAGTISEFVPFRIELEGFLSSAGLNHALVRDNGWWSTFMSFYARIIQDCPLKCVSQGLKHVDEVVVRVISDNTSEMLQHGFALALEWSWKSLKTGTTTTKQTFFTIEPELAPPQP